MKVLIENQLGLLNKNKGPKWIVRSSKNFFIQSTTPGGPRELITIQTWEKVFLDLSELAVEPNFEMRFIAEVTTTG